MKSFGFETVYFENHTLDEQIAIIRGADYFVSYHGAGLTNLLFTNNPNLKVLEIHNSNAKLYWHYALFCAKMKINYDCFVGGEMKNDAYYVNEHFSELEAEVAKTKKIVKDYMTDEGAPSSQASEEVIDAPIYDKETILVVDDSNIVRNFVTRLFSEKYGVGSAENGEEAINILKANKNNDTIVSILLDLNMPKANGFKVLDYMKEHNLLEKEPVSIISGDSSKETIDRAFTYGIVDMLGKPFTADDVKSVVEKNIYYKDMNK